MSQPRNEVDGETDHLKHLNKQARHIVLNVYNVIKNEIGDKDALKRISDLTNVSITTIKTIVGTETSNIEIRTQESFKKIDNCTQDLIVKTVHNFHIHFCTIPTLKMIYNTLNNGKLVFPYSLRNLQNCLETMGLDYILDNRQGGALFESIQLLDYRLRYLSHLSEHNYTGWDINIVFLDETFYDIYDKEDASKKTRITMLHAGTGKEWLQSSLELTWQELKTCEADCGHDISCEIFEKWFKTKLLPNIPTNSVIVVDEASYHSRLIDNVPNKTTKKVDIIRFIKDHNVKVPNLSKYKKDGLLDIVKAYELEKRIFIDYLAMTQGHYVRRLPQFYSILNPCELFGGLVSDFVRNRIHRPQFTGNIIDVVKEGISATQGQWLKCCERIRDLEKKYDPLVLISPVMVLLGTGDSSSTVTSIDCSDSDDSD